MLYIWHRVFSTWTLEKTLARADGGQYGFSAITKDGLTLAVPGNLNDASFVDLFRFDTQWPNDYTTRLSIPSGVVTTNQKCSISGDGSRVFLCAHANTGDSCFLYVWDYNEASDTWGRHTPTGFENEPYDFSMSSGTKANLRQCVISSDGNTVAASGVSVWPPRSSETGAGALWIWKYDPTSHTWNKRYDLAMSDVWGGYGASIDISEDGNKVFITGSQSTSGSSTARSSSRTPCPARST